MRGFCSKCARELPPEELNRVELGEVIPTVLHFCRPCACVLAVELVMHAPNLELITWHPASEPPDDLVTVFGNREEWDEPQPVFMDGGTWRSAATHGEFDEDYDTQKLWPPTTWAHIPTGPTKPKHS